MADQSMSAPWNPSVPTSSNSCRIFSAAVGSARCASTPSGPSVHAQLGRNAAMYVEPGT